MYGVPCVYIPPALPTAEIKSNFKFHNTAGRYVTPHPNSGGGRLAGEQESGVPWFDSQ